MAFSAKWAAVHAILAIGVMFVLAVLVVATGDVKDPEKFGEGMGQLSLFVAAGAFGLSYLFQTGRRKTAALAGLGAVAVIGALTAASLTALPRRHALTPAEKAPLQKVDRDGVTRLEQPALGFSILSPGDTFGEMLPETCAALSVDAESHGWCYIDQQAGEIVLVSYMGGGETSKAALEKSIHDIKTGMVKKLTSQLGDKAKLETIEETFEPSERRAHMHYLMVEKGMHVRFEALAGNFGGGEGTVLAITLDTQGDRLAKVGASVAQLHR